MIPIGYLIPSQISLILKWKPVPVKRKRTKREEVRKKKKPINLIQLAVLGLKVMTLDRISFSTITFHIPGIKGKIKTYLLTIYHPKPS